MEHKSCILIVEDEPDMTRLVSMVMSDLPCRVLQAKCGVDALKILESTPVVAVISDIHMEPLSGTDLLKEIRSRGMETPFIFLSATTHTEDLLAAIRWGAMAYMSKPFEWTELKDLIEGILKLGVAFEELSSEVQNLSKQDVLISEKFTRYREALTEARMRVPSA